MSTTPLSPERLKYHEFLEKFKARLKPGCMVVDIGKSDIHDYRETFEGFSYVTVDHNTAKNPDLVIDVEESSLCNFADGLLCNGVVEQCNNPFKLIDGVVQILKPSGYVLFGIVSIGYPLYSNDRVRFTPTGASLAMLRSQLITVDWTIVYRNNVPSYLFYLCQKPILGEADQ